MDVSAANYKAQTINSIHSPTATSSPISSCNISLTAGLLIYLLLLLLLLGRNAHVHLLGYLVVRMSVMFRRGFGFHIWGTGLKITDPKLVVSCLYSR